ncbi:DUF1127 domain-containing protein [Pseudomonas stutzeri]|nr:DUF1127 domain-containing protein [Stutzerimonas stutzeri]
MCAIRNIRWIDPTPGRKLAPFTWRALEMKGQSAFVQRVHTPSFNLQSLSVVAHAAWARLVRWQMLHRQRQQLAALSDEMLKDIGRSRADVEAEVSRPFWDDPLRRR